LRAARMNPGRFQSLSLIAPSGFDRRLMNPQIRWICRIPGTTMWLGPQLQARCIQRMKDHQSRLTSEMDDKVGYVYGRSRYWAATNPHFAGAVCSQIRELPSDAALHDELEAIATTEIPISILRFGAEEDSTDDGLSPFLNGIPKARIEQLESGSHMGLLEHTDDVNAWVRSTLC
jgi:pimeloyl-ACP methyl ester carboxylesterase